MPLGDSITEGVGSIEQDGYRRKLYEDLQARFSAERIRVNMVGSLKHGPAVFDNDHEGHAGFMAEGGRGGGILPNLYSWLERSPPDLILLHIGTNDINSRHRQHPARVYRLLDEIDRWSTKTEVVLAQIINRAPVDIITTDYNHQVADMVREHRGGDRILLVNQEPALDYTSDVADALHPNDLGYAKMADTWYPTAEATIARLCSGPPVFQLRPNTTAAVGQSYREQLHALGEPPLRYRLLRAPRRMKINKNTGLITWTPRSSVSELVRVEVSNARGQARRTFYVNAFDRIVDSSESRTASDTGATNTDAVRRAESGLRYRPTINSVARRIAYPLQRYLYVVTAEGRPAPTFRLEEAPAGMRIDRKSGAITWWPARLGSYRVVVIAKNSRGTARQRFTLGVVDHILNNGGPGTASSGDWRISNAPRPYGLSSLASNVVNSEYSFTTEAFGLHEIDLWWTALPDRETAVPVHIFDGDSLLATVQVDQTQNGGRWNPLGQYTFETGAARLVVRYPGGGRSASADSVRFRALAP